ncbi:MAG: hypothetical protein HQM08_23320 [Candidatus Riflebacteria bacterium]|nr:hypothetical protein [Candidatus Riflebacteria bacterium]
MGFSFKRSCFFVVFFALFVTAFVPSAWAQASLSPSIVTAVEDGSGKVFFFKGNKYIRFDIKADKADPDYPKPIGATNWPGLPWTDGINAAFNNGQGKIYFFKGDQFVRFDVKADKVDPDYPKPIDATNWPGLPWKGAIDAAFNNGQGKVFIFKGKEYVRYDINADKVDPDYPKPIDAANWPGLPWKEGIGSGFYAGEGKAYIFKGEEYVRYDIKADKVDPDYPKPVNNDNWSGIGALLK